MELIDSHAHLDLLDDAPAALARAAAAGVGRVVTIGIDLESSRAAEALAREHRNVFFTAGLHPHDAAKASEEVWREFRGMAARGARAIGECGLDYFRNRSPKEDQRRAFLAQIDLALELNLPLVIHDRDAHADTLGILEDRGADRVGGVVHCFSGGPAEAGRALKLGFHLGVTGVVTFPKAGELKEVVAMAPLERLLVETDCPFLAPQAYRGKTNEPAYLPHMLQEIARIKEVDPEKAAAVITANTVKLFRLEPGEGA